MGDPKEDEKAITLHNQVSMMIRNLGLEKTILHLQSVNKDMKSNSEGVAVYEFIIKTITSIFKITEVQLYEGSTHFTSTDARMVAYSLIHVHVNCSHKEIALQFGKTPARITQDIKEMKRRLNNRSMHSDKSFFDKYEMIEKAITEFMESAKKRKK